MTIVFTEEELKWIDKKHFDWKVKDGCPEKLKNDIIKKLNVLNKKAYDYEEGFK